MPQVKEQGRVADPGPRPAYVPPANPTQLRLVGIWEQLLSVERVGIDDNFFHCGGSSMGALRMFARLEGLTGENVAPSSLLLNPTIRQLARVLDSGTSETQWNNLVPQRVSGGLPPAFCFHGGMGHVLMYRPLTEFLDPDRPVYALQPNGIDGVSELDGSIEEMARHYLAEIDRLGAPDPLILVSYCYSGTICLEIGRQLVAAGRPAPVFIGADIDPPGLFFRPGAPKIRRPGSPSWYWGHLRLGRWTELREQVAADFIPAALIGDEMRLRLRARRLKQGLVRVFEDYREKTYDQPICLIRSRGLQQWDSYAYVMATWDRISGGQLTVRDVDCEHHELFETPAVRETARYIEEYIREGCS
nr:thioesterase domain-containing protein [Lewinella sp. JB7]